MTRAPRPSPAPAPAPAIGLALGGGGARGLAHLKVIEAFDELGLRPAAIAGTSIGALVGAAYAMGLSARDILARAEQLVGGRRRAIRHIFASRPATLQGVLGVAGGRGSLLNAMAIAEAVLPEAKSATFASLAIPMAVTATDFNARTAAAIADGPLLPALAASMALPVLFSPVEIAGRYHADGGLTNPLPYDLLPGSCDIIIAIDVTGGPTGDQSRQPSTLDMLVGSVQIMLAALVAAKLAASPPDILIRPPVDQFRLLDIFRFGDIIAAATPVKDTVKRELADAITAFGRRKTGA